MKRNAKRVLSLFMTLCMLLGSIATLTTVSFAEEPLIQDYDTANDGDILYTVDFRMEDGVYTKHYVDDNGKQTYTFSEDGRKLTISDKAATGAACYSGYLKDFRITGHVYTISYYTECTDLANVRVAVHHYVETYADRKNNSGTTELYRLGLNTQKGKTNLINYIANGTNRENTANSVDRKVDADNNNRQYFKVVVDGVNLVTKYYAMDKTGAYALLGEVAIDSNIGYNSLVTGLFTYDTLVDGDVISLGDMTIAKGDAFKRTEKTAYEQKYDAAANGDVLYDVNFKADNAAGIQWGDLASSALLTDTSISEDGKTLLMNSATAGAQRISGFLPAREMIRYGSYTYEFFVDSGNRTGLNVLGFKTGTSAYGMGFCYFNTDSAIQFVAGGNFLKLGQMDKPLEDSYGRSQAISYVKNVTPDTSDPTKPNVKIEVDTKACVITNYLLIDGAFVKTAAIRYGGASHVAVVYPYAYNANTNASYSNMVIKKGLSVSGAEGVLVDISVNGKYTTSNPTLLADATLPVPAEKAYHTVVLTTMDGAPVTSLEQFTFQAGMNVLKLKAVYTPVAVKNNVELRGIQTSLTPNTENNTTSVRFIGAVDSLDFDAVGFNLYVVYKDQNGNVIETANEDGVNKGTSSVYGSVLAGVDAAVTATDLGTNYLYAVTVNNVPNGEGVQVDFYVVPYYVVNGETVLSYENEAVCSIVNGEYVKNAPAIG
ncbi:MAG: hypothetical protein E7620_03910 [Ruminococcaceae bacterium]|nr:hypothetical protein [Oscillospiraceae bacterium]